MWTKVEDNTVKMRKVKKRIQGNPEMIYDKNKKKNVYGGGGITTAF